MRERRLPIGAEPTADGNAHFRVWAPHARTVEVVTALGEPVPLTPEGDGYFSGLVTAAGPGTRYQYRLDRGPRLADPASRFQPEGVHGPSEVVDPCAFRWSDAGWAGMPASGHVVYEMHVGTFTPEGTWAAALCELPELAATGLTVLELMPVAEFPGRFGWGYDGVFLFAPTRLYGGPDDFRRFVDAAHGLGLAVILDVVYNHLGPDGCVLRDYAPEYFTDRYANEWGEALNFDGAGSGPVRELFESNARYWIDEFHLDGLRFDATQQIFDASPEHLVAAVGRAARRAAGPRGLWLVAENEPQDTRLVAPIDRGGHGLDALWNDDFHHSARVALTGRREAYYTDYLGRPQELVSATKHGFLYQGQHYSWQKKPRGTSTRQVPAQAFVAYLDNHDQIANAAHGARIHALTAPALWRALTALLLLGPATPMLFQGQEFAASAPFLYFADHGPALAAPVREGRVKFLAQFPSIAAPAVSEALADPASRATFERCKLDLTERRRHAAAYALHRDLLRLRREDAVFAAQGRGGLDGAVLGDDAFVLRWFGEDGDDRLLLVNLGVDLTLTSMPEPLLAPGGGSRWTLAWSSEDPRYGGGGAAPWPREGAWTLPGQAAVALRPERAA
ncbi:MAG TPA: malto-oligosyltrehalose trehalohydrolase [Methylomirabilota bacterium]|jgi:maltooligosyltrehalose trehalohydrolase|nr:malto-oligosyltrehalose trehalohydrolase [Methylomirabilota bacterium]